MLLFSYMVKLAHVWRGQGAAGDVDPRLFGLLDGISRLGSLQQAARDIELSYRHAWGLVAAATHAFGTALVKLERGRGAALTEMGEALLQLDRLTARQLAPSFKRLEREFSKIISHYAVPAPAVLVIHASHDLALEFLRDLAGASKGLKIELHTRGSLESLDSFAHGHCDVAGFHVPSRITAQLARRYLSRLKSRPVQLINLVERQQGLIVARGNPKHIVHLRDLTRAAVRFINRQPASGTRLLFDQLLAGAGLRPQRINGYQSEEFTHGAVAAMIASGMADAGFGIEAAARQHGLDFVRLARERYYLAAHQDAAGSSALALLCTLLRGRKFKTRVAQLPGYDATLCGVPATLDEVLRSSHAVSARAAAGGPAAMNFL